VAPNREEFAYAQREAAEILEDKSWMLLGNGEWAGPPESGERTIFTPLPRRLSLAAARDAVGHPILAEELRLGADQFGGSV
jgi:hypothetical protein